MSDDNKDFDGIKYRAETGSPLVFRLLFSVLIVWAFCFMVYYLFISGWSSQAEFAQKKQAKQEQLAAKQSLEALAAAAAGQKEGSAAENTALIKKEFKERCAACHGAEGKGGIGPDLTASGFKYGKNEEAIAQTIRDGRPGGMPSFGKDLSQDKITGFAKFILSLK